MPRNMSFMITTEQIKNRTKTVTRRLGWNFLKPGEVVNACEKCRGLKAGQKVNKLCQIRIIGVRKEPLNKITKRECVLEGFPDMKPEDFVSMFCALNNCKPTETVNRIEFEYF